MKRILNLEGAINLRELGGYPTKDGTTIKYNKLLRSGDISNLTGKSLAYLKKYGLKYVVDFRSNDEQRNWADTTSDFYKIYSDPVYPLKGNGDKLAGILNRNSYNYLGMIYQSVVLDTRGQQAYKLFFDLLLHNDQPDTALLFHCAAGKDRTGIGALLILKALGVDDETITKDYLLTNLMYESDYEIDKILNDKSGNQSVNKMNMSKADLESITSVYEAIDHYYGSFENYLDKALDIDADKLARLKDIYTTKD
ncbi:tyrosine-protein phosphatase [Companilactobacillus nantensis]|uniref:Protein tyrosine phosphatase n=1 Tax=Companilactobacillus nantensis DSM 16982 TaxID=1423774 RepID=A0A0R1W970_9LACO|nr:tyrosine-protein phosphatase [Companilactobacillus nantensis]KRM14311.1 protein tyrosine phosphatase [Companilactobacillus nantensis DSM 16982]GEO65369.1 protein-tyrosine-phosphatase [Companilactobacillus nantensis]